MEAVQRKLHRRGSIWSQRMLGLQFGPHCQWHPKGSHSCNSPHTYPFEIPSSLCSFLGEMLFSARTWQLHNLDLPDLPTSLSPHCYEGPASDPLSCQTESWLRSGIPPLFPWKVTWSQERSFVTFAMFCCSEEVRGPSQVQEKAVTLGGHMRATWRSVCCGCWTRVHSHLEQGGGKTGQRQSWTGSSELGSWPLGKPLGIPLLSLHSCTDKQLIILLV